MPGRVLRRLAQAGLALVAVTPILVSAVEVGRTWVPVSDTAIVATRARDVFTSRTPLLGQPSTAGIDIGEDVHHPGPLEYWTIAVAQQVRDGPTTSLVAVAVVNVIAVAVAVSVASRVGGVPLASWTAAVLAAMGWSLRGEVLVDPLNPYAALFPFTAFLVCCVAVSARRWWALVPGALLGSYAAQAHLTTAGMVAIATVGTALGLVVAAPTSVPGAARRSPRSAWLRPASVAALLLVGCWAGPLLDVIGNGGGNVAALAATGGARSPADGALRASLDKAANAVGPLPVWLRSGADVPSLLDRPRETDWATTLALVVAAVALGLVARRRGASRAVTGAAAVAVTLLAGGTLLFARLPTAFFNVFALGNYLWLWPAAALLWSVVVVGAVAAVRGGVTGRDRAVGAAGALAAAVAMGFAVASVVDPTSAPIDRQNPAIVRALSAQLASTLERDTTYLFDLSVEFDEQAVDTGVVHELVRRGFDIRVPPFFEPSYDWRADAADTRAVLEVVVDRTAPEGHNRGEVVASFEPPSSARRNLQQAERAVIERLQASGGLDDGLFPAFGKPVPPSVEAFVRGDFLTMAATGFLGDAVRWPQTKRLAEARRQPVLRAAVFLRPSDP